MNTLFVATTLASGLAAALLAWAGLHLGSASLPRYHKMLTADAAFRLSELFLFIDPARLFVVSLGGAAVLGVLAALATGQLVAGLLTAGACTLLPRLILHGLRQRRLAVIEQQLPDALQVIAGGLRAGVSLPLALQQLVREGLPPLAQEIELVLRAHRLGKPLDQALEDLAARLPLQPITLIIAAMRIATETGGSLAEALERAAITVRAQLAMEGKIRALTAQGKLQALVVGLLPLLLLAVLDRLEPEAMAVLWTTPMGWATLAGVTLLELAGMLLIRRVIAIDV